MNAKAYFGDALIAAADEAGVEAVNWTEMSNIQDLDIGMETGEANVTTRANSGWEQTAATLKKGTLTFNMIFDNGDAGFTAIQTAFMAAAEISLLALTGDQTVTGTEGLASNFTITNWSQSQPLEEAIKVAVTAKPSSFTLWYEQTGA